MRWVCCKYRYNVHKKVFSFRSIVFFKYKILAYEVYTEVRAIGGDHLGTNVMTIKERNFHLLA